MSHTGDFGAHLMGLAAAGQEQPLETLGDREPLPRVAVQRLLDQGLREGDPEVRRGQQRTSRPATSASTSPTTRSRATRAPRRCSPTSTASWPASRPPRWRSAWSRPFRSIRTPARASRPNLRPMAVDDKDLEEANDLSVAPIVGPDDPRRFTDSGIEIEPLYTEDDIPDDLDDRLGEPGEFPFTRGPHREMYRKQLWTMRQYAGYAQREGVQRALPLPAQARRHRALHGLRPADPARPRLRRPALPRRGRPHRRRDRLARGHADRLRRHPARRGLDLDDDQRPRRRAAAALPARRRGAGRRPGQAPRHDPERHPQGVHRPRELHLPARAERCGS